MAARISLSSAGSIRMAESPTSSTSTPPEPSTRYGPIAGSRLMPTMSSATASVTMRSTSSASPSPYSASAASHTLVASRRSRRTAPASLLCTSAAPTAFNTTGKPNSFAAFVAFCGSRTTREGGTGTPCSARRRLLHASSSVTDLLADSRVVTGGGVRTGASSPTVTSMAERASSIPSSGSTPARIIASARDSGRHSGNVAITTARPPVAPRAAISASVATSQSASLQRSVRG